jgi:hypothetical protein
MLPLTDGAAFALVNPDGQFHGYADNEMVSGLAPQHGKQ